MKQGQLIAVNGKIYEYHTYNKHLEMHLVFEVEIDEEGILTLTGIPGYLANSELSHRKIDLTEKQWIGLTKHFLVNDFNISDEVIAKNIVDSFATARTPLVEELPNYIAIYLN